MDTEQIGALKAGTSAHRKFRSSLTSINLDNSNKIEHKKVSVCSAKTLFNDNHFTSKIPGILKEYEFDLAQTNLNKIFTAQWLDDRRVIMGTKCNKVLGLFYFSVVVRFINFSVIIDIGSRHSHR